MHSAGLDGDRSKGTGYAFAHFRSTRLPIQQLQMFFRMEKIVLFTEIIIE